MLFDSMRAVAVLGVLFVHVGASSGANADAWYGVATSQGRLGVRIFFMISAFLLYRPYAMAHLHGVSEPALRTYAMRRALRILPAYWVALTVLAIWPGLRGVWTENWWVYYGMLQGYWGSTQFSGLTVAWSLTVEVAFYAALPFLALSLGWLGHGSSARTRMFRELAALALLGLAAGVLRIYVFTIGRLDLTFTLLCSFLPFAIGMALAVASAWLGANERRWRWSRFVIDQPGACWSAAIGVFVALCFTPVFKRTFIGGSHSMLTWGLEQLAYVVISALLLLPVVFGEEARGWPRRLLGTRFLCFTGAVSYGVFLWHLPLLLWMSRAGWTKWIPGSPFLTLLLLTLLIALLFAWASYRLVELPAMRLRGEPPKRAT